MHLQPTSSAAPGPPAPCPCPLAPASSPSGPSRPRRPCAHPPASPQAQLTDQVFTTAGQQARALGAALQGTNYLDLLLQEVAASAPQEAEQAAALVQRLGPGAGDRAEVGTVARLQQHSHV